MSDLLYKPDKSRRDVDELLAQHKNLVYYMLGQMQQLYNQDCESAAWEALWDAIETFNPYEKTAFSTYACKLIKNAVNAVLRKQSLEARHEAVMVELSEQNQLFLPVDLSNNLASNVVESLFSDYVATKTGTVKNVLLVWQAQGFDVEGKNIAKVCGCSPSYVSRVQRDFRAYLLYKMKAI